jgi:hypothetical protein
VFESREVMRFEDHERIEEQMVEVFNETTEEVTHEKLVNVT